jgi:predicted transcriptional regulator
MTMKNEYFDVPVEAILTNTTLDYLDIYTFFVLKSFFDTNINNSLCSVVEVAKRMGTTIIFANNSIRSLIEAGLIKCSETGRRIDRLIYSFEPSYKTIKIPREILNESLSRAEKISMIILKMLLSSFSNDKDLFFAKVEEIEKLYPSTELVNWLVCLTGYRYLHIEVPISDSPYWQLTDKINWNVCNDGLVIAAA